MLLLLCNKNYQIKKGEVLLKIKCCGICSSDIERVFINSYDWRRKVYNSAGFKTIDTIGFWYKKIK